MVTELSVLDRVRLNVPYRGGNGEAYTLAFVSETLDVNYAGRRLYSVSPYTLETSCAGRVAVVRYYYCRHVDFSARELKLRKCG